MIVPMAPAAAVYVEDDSMLEAKCHGSEVIIQNAGAVTVQQLSRSSEFHPYLDDLILPCPLTCYCKLTVDAYVILLQPSEGNERKLMLADLFFFYRC